MTARRILRPVRRASEEGAAMLVVLFVLLMATATAVYAVQSTSTEIRAAGHHRMAAQTQQLGESGLTAALAWVDRTGPGVLMSSTAQSAGTPLDLAPFETTPLAPNKNALRLYASAPATDSGGGTATGELNVSAITIDSPEAVLGPRRPQTTFLAVDVYDSHQFVGVLAGYPASAQGNLKFLSATYTARARTMLPTEAIRDPLDQRYANETASDARARAVSGPF